MSRAIGFAILLAAVAAWPGLGGEAGAQVSPGPLAEAHRDLERPLDCFKCHDRKGSMDARCLACHTEVAWMRDRRKGFHARVNDRACARCHPDHGGRDFALIVWDEGSPEAFDHRRAGYPLQGRHAAIECRACHQPRLQRSPAARLVRRKDRGKSWLGLETACASCHADPHRGQLGTRCESCHDARAWTPAPGFDHAKTDYPLTGKHAQVACEQCHASPRLPSTRDPDGKPVPIWKPLAHRECTPCHRDPHAGRFGAGCAKCHSTASFQTIDRRGFDHDRTRYPLRGKHAALECASCHDPRRGGARKPPFARCDDCHRDPHAGLATIAGKPADCATCHAVAGFHPSTFTVLQHQTSAYPLAGAHARADCSLCHARLEPGAAALPLGPARVVLRPLFARCEDCHLDPHAGRFAARGERPQPRECLACHDLERFRPSGVDVAAHGRLSFPLEGAHRAVPCQACHAELMAAASRSSLRAAAAHARPLRFAERSTRCSGCHADPHGGQFAERRDRGACEACHGVEAWTPAARFDHDRDARFRLQGAHARVPCGRCHPIERDASGARRVVYRPIPTACESCHTDPPSRSGGSRRGRSSSPPASFRLTIPEQSHATR